MDEDSLLAKNVRDLGCDESIRTLIQKHTPLYYNIYKNYETALIMSGADTSEFLQDKDYVIYKAATSFNPAKNVKFSTWLANQVRYECLNTINKRKRFIPMEPKDVQFHMDKTQKNETPLDKDMGKFVFSILNQVKDKRIKRIFEIRYYDGEKNIPWSEVSRRMEISIQTAINLHNKGRRLLAAKLRSKQSFDTV